MNALYGPPQRDPPALRTGPDLAATPVHDVVGQPVGAIFASLAEAASGLIRYLDIELEERQRHVLVPIGHVRLEERDGTIRIRLLAASREELEAIPDYAPGETPSDHYQRTLLSAHSRLFYGERYYAHPAYDHSGLYAGSHPVLSDDDTSGRTHDVDDGAEDRLRHMQELHGYRVSSDQLDVRGRPLLASDGAEIGTVADLVVDVPARKVRYLVVSLDSACKLLPVGFVSIERDPSCVRTPALDESDIRSLPEYRGPPLTRDFEDSLRDALERCVSAERRFMRPDFRSPPDGRSRKR